MKFILVALAISACGLSYGATIQDSCTEAERLKTEVILLSTLKERGVIIDLEEYSSLNEEVRNLLDTCESSNTTTNNIKIEVVEYNQEY